MNVIGQRNFVKYVVSKPNNSKKVIFLTSGSGGILECSDCKSEIIAKTDILGNFGSNIYGYNEESETGNKFIWGDKYVSYHSLYGWKSIKFDDWIWDVKSFGNEVCVLFGHNRVALYNFDNKTVSLKQKSLIQSEEKCLILCGKLYGTEWSELMCLSGTIFGNIIVWKPSLSGRTITVLRGHEGAVFNLSFNRSFHFLSSVSDDRSLRVWKFSLQEPEKSCCLAVGYGHTSRPWTVAFAGEFIASSGHDSNICLWLLCGNKLELYKILSFQCGPILSIDYCPINKQLAYCSSTGSLGSIDFPAKEEALCFSEYNLKHFNDSVCAICVVPNGLLFITKTRHLLYYEEISDNITTVFHDVHLKYDTLCLSSKRTSEGQHSFCTVASTSGRIYIIDSETPNSFICHTFTGENLVLNLIWVTDADDLYLVGCFSEGKMILWRITSTADISEIGTFLLPKGRQRWASCGILFERKCEKGEKEKWLAVGDRNGSVLIYSLKTKEEQIPAEPDCICSKVHARNGVTDIIWKSDFEQLWTIGRDSKLCKWRFASNKLLLLDKQTIGAPETLEWPAKFFEKDGNFWILGFHANEFSVFDCDLNSYLCNIECGGGHRHWQMVYENGENSIKFHFIKQGNIYQAQAFLWKPNIIKPHLHTQQIIAMVVLPNTDISESELSLLTASIDTTLTVSRWKDNNNLQIVQRLNHHLSSVHSLSVYCDLICSGGGKSELILWKFTSGHMTPLTQHRDTLNTDVRILSLQLLNWACFDEVMWIVTVRSDGNVWLYNVNISLSTLIPVICLTSNIGCCVKAKSIIIFDNLYVFGVTTNGRLICWSIQSDDLTTITNRTSESIRESNEKCSFEMEKCGLSCLNVSISEVSNLISVGSESGCVTISLLDIPFVSSPSVCKTEQIHAATVTAIQFLTPVQFCSVGLDQRLCITSVYVLERKITISLDRVLMLSIPDPADLALLPSVGRNCFRLAVCGAGFQIISIEIEK